MSAKNVWDEGRWAAVTDVTIDFMTEYIIEKILACVSPRGKTTVELGSGTGRLSYLLLKNGARKVTMVDSSKKAISLTKNLFRNEHPDSYDVVESDLMEFDASGKFDISFSSGVIEHFRATDRRDVIQKHVDAAKSDSIILHPSNTLYQRLFSVFPPAVKLYGFARPYSIAEMDSYIESIKNVSDFSHEQFYSFYSVPLLHNRKKLNKLVDSTALGKLWGGFILTHLALDGGCAR